MYTGKSEPEFDDDDSHQYDHHYVDDDGGDYTDDVHCHLKIEMVTWNEDDDIFKVIVIVIMINVDLCHDDDGKDEAVLG